MNHVNNNCYAEKQEVSNVAPQEETCFNWSESNQPASIASCQGELCPIENIYNEVNVKELNQLFGRQTAKAMKFLMDRVDAVTLAEFLTIFVYPERLAQMATAEIVVRCTAKGIRRSHNTGFYQIFVQNGEGQSKLLHFTNQVSTVYYLMFLIDRHQKQGPLSPLCLSGNKAAFMEIYHRVYDNISHEEMLRRYNSLLFRQEGKRLRAGRQNEIIYDIRLHLSETFESLGGNFLPYAMTASSHLTVPAGHIVFEGAASELLQVQCV